MKITAFECDSCGKLTRSSDENIVVYVFKDNMTSTCMLCPRCYKRKVGLEALADLFMDRHNGLPMLEYWGGDFHIYVTKHQGYRENPETGEWENPVDVEETNKVLKSIVASLRKKKLPVEKKYENDYFKIKTRLSETVSLEFIANRQSAYSTDFLS